MEVGLLTDLRGDVYECIKHSAELGFKSGQVTVWDMDLYNDDTVQEVKRACADFDFRITGVWCGWSGPVVWSYPEMYTTLGLVPSAWRERRTFDLLKGAEFARKLGVRDIITHIGYLPDDPTHPDNIGVMQAVRYIGQQIKPYGQRFLFETGEELPTTIMILMNQTGCNNLGINFDPSNLLTNGRSEPVLALRRFLPVLGGFHAKDGIAAVGAEPKGKQKEIGTGEVDFKALFTMLHEAGMDDMDITIEFEIPGVTERDEPIKRSKKYLENMIGEICNG